jgi:hypothetical protein
MHTGTNRRCRICKLSLLLAVVALSLSGLERAWAELLPVPQNLVALDSSQGEQLLLDAESKKAYFPLGDQFVTQENQAFCGVASLVMVLNALHVPAPESVMLKPFSAFDQSNVFNAQTEVVVPRVVIERKGMTLDQIGGIAAAWGLNAAVHHAADSSLEEFRQLVRTSLATGDQYVVVNFLRSAIGEEKFGHISPLAAYDADTDRFLLLDVARYKYPPVWISAAELFAAMNTADSDNDNHTRGYVIVRR